MDIGPGDWVECVKSSCGLTAGSIHMVLEVFPHPDNACCDCRCMGTPNMAITNDPYGTASSSEDAWCPCIFRPFHGPEIEREKWREKLPERSILQMLTASLTESHPNHTTPPQLSPEPQ